jgi:hypothetical protein
VAETASINRGVLGILPIGSVGIVMSALSLVLVVQGTSGPTYHKPGGEV